MNKNRIFIILLAIFLIGFSINSVFAIDNTNGSDELSAISDSDSVDNLNAIENVSSSERLEKYDDSNAIGNLSVSENSYSENLSVSANSSEEVLSSSVSVSSGHTYHKCGYSFTVSPYQYKKIKEAISAGKKRTFLDYGFEFKVKTNKVIKTKVLVKTKTYYKKVKYEKFVYPYTVKLISLSNYYKNGWKKYKSEWYMGNHYAYLKKTVKTYKTVKMRVYATISYVGEYDYVTGEHLCYPFVAFDAMKQGYPSKYLTFTVLK